MRASIVFLVSLLCGSVPAAASEGDEEALLLGARKLVNEGQYAEALHTIDPVARVPPKNGHGEAARRLAGALMVVTGRYSEGLAMLDASRASPVAPVYPALPYSKSFESIHGDAQRVAVGLLECVALGMSHGELLGRDRPFYEPATLRSLRLLSRALQKTKPAAAKTVDTYFRKWLQLAATQAPEGLELLRRNLAEDEDRVGSGLVKRAAAARKN